jgi:putative ABC transport system substrate-binding protein
VSVAAGALGAPLFTFAQSQGRVHRIGILAPDSLESRRPLIDIFIRAMREFGYIEGKNIIFEPRYAGGDVARLSALGAELAALNPDVIVTPNGIATLAAARAAETAKREIPIVFAGWANPAGTRLVATLARPGGHVTGLSNVTVEVAGKLLHLLKDAYPRISRVAVFIDSTTSAAAAYAEEVERATQALGMQALSVELRNGGDVEQVVAAMHKWRADSMLVLNAPINFNNRKLVVQIAEKMRLPAVYGNDVFPIIGGLMSYGSDDKLRWTQIATYVDKILKGARAGDLPIELPTKFDFVINLKTARALGMAIPPSILARANRLIE